MKLRELLVEGERRLRTAGTPDPAQDARRITEHAAGCSSAELLAAGEGAVNERVVAHHAAMVSRRAAGEPLQYVLGAWGFRGLDLMVDHRVLIPRPETEQLVDHALVELQRVAADRPRRPLETSCVAVDLGTGSGAIALALVEECPAVAVWGVERSGGALAVARANLAGVGRAGARVRLVEGSWFDPLPAGLVGTVDVIVANPPYVAEADPLPDEVARWEPLDALIPGPTGLEAIAEVVVGAPRWLRDGGTLLVEIGETQGEVAASLAAAAGLAEVEVRGDLAGRDRFLIARSASHPR